MSQQCFPWIQLCSWWQIQVQSWMTSENHRIISCQSQKGPHKSWLFFLLAHNTRLLQSDGSLISFSWLLLSRNREKTLCCGSDLSGQQEDFFQGSGTMVQAVIPVTFHQAPVSNITAPRHTLTSSLVTCDAGRVQVQCCSYQLLDWAGLLLHLL